MYYTVYKTTNLINGKIYVGAHKTENLEDGYLGSGKYLNNAINRYGKENFSKDIIAICDTKEEMYEIEENLVSEAFLVFFSTYNIKLGGEGGFDHLNSKEGINKREKAIKVFLSAGTSKYRELYNTDLEFRTNVLNNLEKARSKSPIMKVGYFSKEFSKLGREAARLPEARNKQKETFKRIGHAKGINNSQYGTCWITNSKENKKIIKGSEVPSGWRLGRIKVRTRSSVG